jgi:hypothetical protein
MKLCCKLPLHGPSHLAVIYGVIVTYSVTNLKLIFQCMTLEIKTLSLVMFDFVLTCQKPILS